MRAASGSFKRAKVVRAESVDEATAMMKAEIAQAFALTNDALPTLQKQLPGSCILDGAFQTTGVAIAAHKDHRLRSRTSRTSQSAKPNGIVWRAFDDAGLNRLPVAT
jgi:polar amino acid transport system substrate-binding protein